MGQDTVLNLPLLKAINSSNLTIGTTLAVTMKNLTVKAMPAAHTMHIRRGIEGCVVVEGIWDGEKKQFWVCHSNGTHSEVSEHDAHKLMDDTVTEEDYDTPPEFTGRPWNEVQEIPGFVIPKDKLRVMQSRLRRGHNILVKGEPGTGKTVLAELFAQRIGYPFHRLNVSGIQRTVDWFGDKNYSPDRGTHFDPSEFIRRLQQPGIIQLDEINRTSPENPNAIFGFLDDIRWVYVEPLGRKIYRHPNCYIFGTLNEGPQFTGTYPLDPAFQDRFTVMELQLPAEEELAKLLIEQVKPNGKGETLLLPDAIVLAKAVRTLADLYADGKISKYAGFRVARNAAELRVDGEALDFAARESIINIFSNEGGTSSERTKILLNLQAHFPSFASDPAILAAKKKSATI